MPGAEKRTLQRAERSARDVDRDDMCTDGRRRRHRGDATANRALRTAIGFEPQTPLLRMVYPRRSDETMYGWPQGSTSGSRSFEKSCNAATDDMTG